MTDYPVDVDITGLGGALSPTTPDWFEDNNPATVATFHTAGSVSANGFDCDLHADFTAITGLIGWRIEVDVISGVGQLFWNFEFDKDSPSGYAAFNGTIDVTGPGTFVSVAGDPYFVSSAGGHTYGGIYDLVARMANETGYVHAFGELEIGPEVSGDNIVVSEFRVIFFTDDVVQVLRQWPRDDAYGANATPRHYPPPRANRHIGGQP